MTDSGEPKDIGGYSPEQIDDLSNKLRELRNAYNGVRLDLHHLSGQLTIQRAKTFANEAMGRRLPVIERSVLNIFDLYPPNRSEFLTRDECSDIAIQLHAFAINVYAIFDNAAWICMLEAGESLPPVKVGLFRKECRKFIPPTLVDYIAQSTVEQWFNDYGKLYRDSTAHRIPPYLPERAYTHAEGERYQEIDKESWDTLLNWNPDDGHEETNERLARHEKLEEEKYSLGRNSLLVSLTLTGEDAAPSIYLHPQLLSDWGLIHEFVQKFTQSMRQHYGWEPPTIPEMVVN